MLGVPRFSTTGTAWGLSDARERRASRAPARSPPPAPPALRADRTRRRQGPGRPGGHTAPRASVSRPRTGPRRCGPSPGHVQRPAPAAAGQASPPRLCNCSRRGVGREPRSHGGRGKGAAPGACLCLTREVGGGRRGAAHVGARGPQAAPAGGAPGSRGPRRGQVRAACSPAASAAPALGRPPASHGVTSAPPLGPSPRRAIPGRGAAGWGQGAGTERNPSLWGRQGAGRLPLQRAGSRERPGGGGGRGLGWSEQGDIPLPA